ncbi:MAG: glycosyltransferase family 9 protein [Opitutaceae bacterium]|jgi:heptosyltransferase-2|nr:glycosyltransferase family 9 protein [Opitutaceae bacterium]
MTGEDSIVSTAPRTSGSVPAGAGDGGGDGANTAAGGAAAVAANTTAGGAAAADAGAGIWHETPIDAAAIATATIDNDAAAIATATIDNDDAAIATAATTAAIAADPRPRTVVLQQYAGIGDLIWHIPYFREAARRSRGGRVSVISQPSTLARELLAHEPWIEEVIYYDHRRRKHDRATPRRHAGFPGMWRMARELKGRRFDRALFFTHRPNRAVVAWLAGIPRRSAYGFGWLQRLFLNEGPFIKPYRGPSLEVYRNASAFAIAHGLCAGPIVPKMTAPPGVVERMRRFVSGLPQPFYAFAIGTSEPGKQWGKQNFAALATELLRQGNGVLLAGGPAEDGLACEIEAGVPAELRGAIAHLTKAHILESVAALSLARACIGNDTGAVNLSAACNRPAYVVLGARKLIDHDPLVHMLTAPRLSDITVADVLGLIRRTEAAEAGASLSG